MSLATAELPSDLTALRAFALACQGELKAAELAVQYNALEIEKLKFQIAKLRRMQFGRSSERTTRQIEQLELRLEELETGEPEATAKAEAEADTAEPVAPIRERTKPKRKPLPDHLPRQEVVHQPANDGAWAGQAAWSLDLVVAKIHQHVFAPKKDPRRRHHGAGAGAGTRADRNRAAVGRCVRRPAVLWSGRSGRRLFLQPRPWFRAPGGAQDELHRLPSG